MSLKDFDDVGSKFLEDPVIFAESVIGFRPFSYQAAILRDNSKRVVACLGRQSGKTTTVAVKAIHFAYAKPKTVTLIVSPSLRQSIILFDRILEFIYSSRFLAKGVRRRTRTIIRLSNGSQIVALPCSAHRLRGHTAHNLIVDEAAFLPDEIITQILFPMLATTDGYLTLLSTPWDRESLFYKAFIDPSYSVHHVKSSACPLITKDFLEEQRRNMTEHAYRMEFEGEFVEAASSYFTQDLIRSCIDPELELKSDIESVSVKPADYYAGCDLGKLRDYSVVAIVKRLKNQQVQLIFLQEFPLATPYSHVIGFIVRANQKFNLRKILIDKSGVGEAVMEEIKNQGLTNAEGAIFTAQKKAEYLAHLRIKMEQKQFKMPYDRRLCSQINSQQYEYTKTGQLKFWHPPNSHDDMLMALCLAVTATKDEATPGVLAKAW